METASKIRTIRSLVRDIDFEGKSLLSINDLSNDQILGMFEMELPLKLNHFAPYRIYFCGEHKCQIKRGTQNI